MGSRCIAGRNDCGVIERRTWLGPHLRRVHEAVTTDPDAVIRDRKIRDEIAALIIGHYGARKLRRQVCRLGNYPDTSFRAFRARYYTADVGAADINILRVELG